MELSSRRLFLSLFRHLGLIRAYICVSTCCVVLVLSLFFYVLLSQINFLFVLMQQRAFQGPSGQRCCEHREEDKNL